ncbi:hypothetical protein C2I36_05480 [Rhodobacteraceae bacterium WD3A24]|nr:hypothetical protein C2I36_05480 [Rhodobacteraceae bacterium WD3A24]
MSHTPHELADDFPDEIDEIHALKEKDAHFARLVERYHEVNRAVHRAETRVEPVSEEREEALRHHRVQLKDEIARELHARG